MESSYLTLVSRFVICGTAFSIDPSVEEGEEDDVEERVKADEEMEAA